MNFQVLFASLQEAGLPGVVLGVLICAFVFVGEFTHLLKDGWMKRLAVVLGGVLFSGLESGEVFSALVAVISMLVAGLLKLALDAGGKGLKQVYEERKKK